MNSLTASGSDATERRARFELLDRLPKNGICAEIGVWKGNFSQQILRHSRPRELHLVDPWLFVPEFPERWYGGGLAKSQDDMDSIHRAVVSRFRSDARVRIHRGTSLDVAATVADGAFDWVYIDGNHSYAAVLNDLVSWKSKLRRGGILAGDDWQWRDEHGFFSVRAAVANFASSEGFGVELLSNRQYLLVT